jgi:phage-related protein
MVSLPKRVTARFYQTALGSKPAREWLLDLTQDDRRIIGQDIQTVEFGWPIGMPVCRSLGQGIWEVRSNLAAGRIARMLFTFVDDEMILLHGFIKKAQATPHHDLELAIKRKKECRNG